MPIYEYSCKKCNQLFELMRPIAKADARAKCTNCGSTAVKRRLSRFAVVSAGDGGGDGGDDAFDMGGGDDDFGGDFGDDDW